jgi:hypothetical protein
MMASPALPPRVTPTCIAALVLNVVWAIALPSASGKLVAAAGACVAAGLLLVVHGWPALRNRVISNHPAFFEWPPAMPLVCATFLAPILFLRATPMFGFWRLDGRASLLLAWLAVTSVALVLESRRGPAEQRWTTSLLVGFIVFSAATWLTVVMDSGVASFMVNFDRRGPRGCQSDPVTEMATVWESNRAADHLYLAWRSQEAFDERVVYANHVHPYLLTMYGWVTAVRRLGGLTLWQASNTSMVLPVLILIAAFALLVARSKVLTELGSVGSLLLAFLGIGVLLTTWRLWIDLVRFNSDNPYPLLASVFVIVYAMLLPPMQPVAAAIAAAMFAALSPVNTPMLLVPVLCLFTRGARDWREAWIANRSVLVVCGVAVIAGVVSYLDPRLLIAWKGYHAQESSFLFRSGLDGDTRYFSGILQAAIAPCPTNCCYARTLSDLVWPAVLPLAIFGPLTIWRGPRTDFSVGRTFLFLASPYLLSLILFPQSVSVHPYLYDHMFLIPVVVTGVLAMLSVASDARPGSTALLATLLLVAAILMSNLIGIAQGLARAMAYFRS